MVREDLRFLRFDYEAGPGLHGSQGGLCYDKVQITTWPTGVVVLTRTSTIFLEGLQDRSNDAVWREFDARYRPLLLSVGRRLGLRHDEAEDAAQEALAAFVVEYRAGRYERGMGRLRDWLAGIMAHKVRDTQRRRMQRDRALERQAQRQAPEADDSAVQRAMEEEWSGAALRRCLEAVREEVAPQMYEAFELTALRQWPAQQAAARLGCSVDLVYQHKHRVLQRMQQMLPTMEEPW